MLTVHSSSWSRERGQRTATGENLPRTPFRDWQFDAPAEVNAHRFVLPTRKLDAHILGQWNETVFGCGQVAT